MPKKRRKRRLIPEPAKRPFMSKQRLEALLLDLQFDTIFNFVADRACHDANEVLAIACAGRTEYHFERAWRQINGLR